MERNNPTQSNFASWRRSGPIRDRRRFGLLHAVLLLNVLMLTGFGIFAVMMFQRLTDADAVPNVMIVPPQSVAVNDNVLPEKDLQPNASGVPALPIDGQESGQNESISLETACGYYRQKAYSKAYYVFGTLRDNLSGRQLEQQCLRDWLTLQMAMCLYHNNPQTPVSDHFTQPLHSRSLFVRAMGNYYLSLINNEKQQYLEARSRAYKTLALLSAVAEFLPETMESDCYFTAAESLTSHILGLNNQDPKLPGQRWTGMRPFYDGLIEDPQQLAQMVLAGTEDINLSMLTPKVEYFPDRSARSQWSGICWDAPLEQLFWRIASEADLAVSWDDQACHRRTTPTTLYLPFVDRQYLLEVVAAEAGLIWRHDGQVGVIYDPVNYQDIQRCQQMLCREAISAWQRFLIRYRNDSRIANAHYCLGRLYEVYDDPSTALGHYKLTYSQFNRNDLAPHALLNAGRVKFALQDYAGARADLNELLVHYPDFTIIGEVVLSLGQATLRCGLYQEAGLLYERAYRMDANEAVSRSALFGRGQCAYESKDYEGCVQWLGKAVNLMSDISDVRRGPACLMLGRSLGELGQNEQASGVLKMALGGTLAQEDYVQILIELAQAECRRENYVEALNILEGAPQDKLSQEDTCRVLLVKTRIYSMLGLTETAMSLLRRQIEFIAEAQLRAKLSMELAYCYMLNGDLHVAQRELNEAMYDLPRGADTWRCGYLLAQIAYRLGDYKKAERRCLQTLQTKVDDPERRNQICELLGEIYTKEKNFANAALAYAGVIDGGRLN